MIEVVGQILADGGDLLELSRHHLTDDARRSLLGGGILLALLGGAMWLYGARLGRALVIVLFFFIGNGIVYHYRHDLPISPVITMPLGGAVAGTVGGILYRSLVACLSAIILSVAAMTVFCTTAVLPGIDVGSVLKPAARKITLESRQVDELQRAAGALWKQVSGVRKAQPGLLGGGAVVLVGSALGGLLLGIYAPRLAMVVWTALGGVGLMIVGLTALLTEYGPQWLTKAGGHPYAFLGTCAGLFLLGAGFQYQQSRTRRAPANVAGVQVVVEPSRSGT